MSPQSRRSFVKSMLAVPVAAAFVWPEAKPIAARTHEDADQEFRRLTGTFPDDQWEGQMQTSVTMLTSMSDARDLDTVAWMFGELSHTRDIWRTSLRDLISRSQLILERLEETYG